MTHLGFVFGWAVTSLNKMSQIATWISVYWNNVVVTVVRINSLHTCWMPSCVKCQDNSDLEACKSLATFVLALRAVWAKKEILSLKKKKKIHNPDLGVSIISVWDFHSLFSWILKVLRRRKFVLAGTFGTSREAAKEIKGFLTDLIVFKYLTWRNNFHASPGPFVS